METFSLSFIGGHSFINSQMEYFSVYELSGPFWDLQTRLSNGFRLDPLFDLSTNRRCVRQAILPALTVLCSLYLKVCSSKKWDTPFVVTPPYFLPTKATIILSDEAPCSWDSSDKKLESMACSLCLVSGTLIWPVLASTVVSQALTKWTKLLC